MRRHKKRKFPTVHLKEAYHLITDTSGKELEKQLRDILIPLGGFTPPNGPCTHEWAVFSTALGEGWLMLQCVNCGHHATIEDPSHEEWSEAYHAPSRPYRWCCESRVVLHP